MNAVVKSAKAGAGGAGLVVVPQELWQRLQAAVLQCAATLGERPEHCQRVVEIAVLQRGIEALEREVT